MSKDASNLGDLYAGREQTRVKHTILRDYLKLFALIIGSWAESITYVDCFSGPWNSQSDELSDTSFSIALKELKSAVDVLKQKGNRSPELRCMFLEKNRRSYAELRRISETIDFAEIRTKNASLEDSIGDICQFINEQSNRSFRFILIDPCGWKDIALDVILPLLRFDPGEVLINFMTGHISRFVLHDDLVNRESFGKLFGNDAYRNSLEGKTGLDKEDALVQCYMRSIQEAGRFKYVLPSVVLRPQRDQTNFHLIYATRHPKGVQVFKDTERSAMRIMEKARSAAQKNRRELTTGQMELNLAADDAPPSKYYDRLRDRYVGVAKRAVLDLLRTKRRVPFHDVWYEALRHQLVWLGDLRDWMKEWEMNGQLKVIGLSKGTRLPSHRNKNHWVEWISV